MKKVLILLGFSGLMATGVVTGAMGQEVEHNYLVGPNVTNCDSLNFDDRTMQLAIRDIRQAKFRFSQRFKLTRRQGFKGGEFYLCGSATGFLIVGYDDKEFLYTDIDKLIWEKLRSSSDPEGYYLDEKAKWHLYP